MKAQQTLGFDPAEKSRWRSCLKYRYTLHRNFHSIESGRRRLLWIMLNPSTADDVDDDPTIRRCISFSQRDGYDGLVVCNVYGLRATDPHELLAVEDPVGIENDLFISDMAHECYGVVLAFGALVTRVPGGTTRARQIYDLVKACGHQPLCLGVTKSGFPRHPLYVRSDQPLVGFDIEKIP